jgi:two-component system response regulator HydG
MLDGPDPLPSVTSAGGIKVAVGKPVRMSLFMGPAILYVDDERANLDLFRRSFDEELSVLTAASGPTALEVLESGEEIGVLVSDQRMEPMTGIELLTVAASRWPSVRRVLLTAYSDRDLLLQAIQLGKVHDYVLKPWRLEELGVRLKAALDAFVRQSALARAETERDILLDEFREREPSGIVGLDGGLRSVAATLERVAPTDSTVMIRGESGTGKELVARTLHLGSPRRAGPFLAINCAAVPENLLEGELFGYERGAFSDAKAPKVGLFVQANGGTLFLDEVGELPLGLQAKLLYALQARVVRPLGSTQEIPFEVRLVTATNRDLETAVEEKRFREDFYFRINVVEVRLPPLRVRGNDILKLAAHFLREFADRAKKPVTAMTPEVGEKLLAYPWPGNVRELQNVIERAVALTQHDHITVQDLPQKVAEHRRSHVVLTDETEFVSLEEMEKRYILQILAAVGGSKSVAARILGLDRTTLWRKLERFHIEGSKPGKS